MTLTVRGVALLAALACGCAEGPRDAPTAGCDPLAIDDCAGGEVCAVTDDGPRCRAPTEPPVDAPCGAASCPAGEACVTVEGLVRCRGLCLVDDADAHPCPDGLACRYRLRASDLGVCAAPCALDDDCGPGGTCGISTALPYPTCVATGPARPGEPCADRRCVDGWACLEIPSPDDPERFEERCARLCDPALDPPARCASGACRGRVLGVEGIGYCTDDS